MDYGEIIKALNAELDIMEVVRDLGGEIKKCGNDLKCCCLLHAEKTPSMSIKPKENRFHCFGCGGDGDCISLYAQVRGIGQWQAAQELDSLYSVGIVNAEISREKEEWLRQRRYEREQEMRRRREEEARANSVDQSTFFDRAVKAMFSVDRRGLDYAMKTRGLSEETIRHFRMGFIPQWVHPKLLNDPSIRNKHPKPVLIVPTSDTSYLARDIRSTDKLNEQEKSRTKMKVGNIHIFNQEVLWTSQTPIFIVEGEFDAASVHEAGYNAIAIGGVGNALKLVELVAQRKPSAPLVIALDNDKAGQNPNVINAMLHGGMVQDGGFVELGIQHTAANIAGEFKDANEFLVADRERFIATVKQEVESVMRQFSGEKPPEKKPVPKKRFTYIPKKMREAEMQE